MSDLKKYDPSGENTLKSIACERIPELFLDKIIAKKYFSKFGTIKRFILRPKRLSCIVEYESKEDAENALTNAGNFNGIYFEVNYGEHAAAHVQNTEEWVDPEVQAELEAMSSGQRLGVNLRPSIPITGQPSNKSNVLSRASKNGNFLEGSTKSTKLSAILRQIQPLVEGPQIDNALRNELEAILRTPALSNEEKYRVLDARDKLIRLTTIRQTDIKKAVATKGTCPDMCPEKERLMREFQRQVSSFELSEEEEVCESSISHRKAVKEYSRSSADQEVPLCHELRNESVLQMTMLYLVHRIMGLCDDPKTSLGDWFHFVWDRTRSIRKDITQQELCSLGAVQLVEQCARFHIHCSARLVAEDPSVFDKKINAENLTKCLQTLKYMYHDLRIKGITCPCEAEFRSYIILLNLGDSNFLWEVKQLPEYIQKSTEIKQSIAFYNALQNNNFVRFFLMIKSSETSYLAACILLGYFTKLRVRAMDAIIKSHNWRKNDVYLPLSYLIRVLGFDDESAAVSFFNYFNLNCDPLNDRVLLDRLTKPDIELTMDRALQLVESKRKISVGECVFGQTLPPTFSFEHHQPQNSFDDNGLLRIDAWNMDNTSRTNVVRPNVQSKQELELSVENEISPDNKILFKIPSTLAPNTPKQQNLPKQNIIQEVHNISDLGIVSKPNKFSSSNTFKFSDNIFGGISTTESIKTSENIATTEYISSATFSDKNIFVDGRKNFNLKSANIFGSTRETANIFQQQNEKRNEFLKNDKIFNLFQSKLDNTISSKTSTQPVFEKEETNMEQSNDIIEKQLKEQAKISRDTEIKKEQEKMRKEFESQMEIKRLSELKLKLQVKTEQETENLFNHLINDELYKIAQTEVLIFQTLNEASDLQYKLLIYDVINECVEDIVQEEYAFMCYDQLLLNRYFNRWLLNIRKKKEQIKLIESTPLWVTTDTRSQYAQSIEHPGQHRNLEMIKRYRLGQSCDFNKILKMESHILYDENQNPINLFALIGEHLLPKQNFTSSGLLQKRKYFKFLLTLPENNEELFGFETFSNKWLLKFIEKSQIESEPFLHGIEENVALCVRKFNGIIPKNEQGLDVTTEGDHNDGIVCFITGVNIGSHSRKRLYNLLKLAKNQKRIPLAIVAYNCYCTKEELAIQLGLDMLREEALIHSFLIVGCQVKRKDFNLRSALIKAIDFITKESYLLNINETQALAMQNVLSFLEYSLGEDMWSRWCDSAERNPIFKKICTIPKHVMGIFHKALDNLLHISLEDLKDMPEFPEELKYFVPKNVSNVPLSLEYFPSKWKDGRKIEILEIFLKNLYLPDVEVLPANVEDLKLWLLNYTAKCVKNDLTAAKASFEAITNLVNQIKMQYLDNIETSSGLGMINYLTIMKPIVFAHINEKLKLFHQDLVNLNVIYLKDDLINYQTQPWWLNYEPLDFVILDCTERTKNLQRTTLQEKNECYTSTNNISEVIHKAEEMSRKAEEYISEFKHKKITHKVAFIASPTSELKRTLDESLYQFELSKKIGEYDHSYLTNEVDNSTKEALTQPSPLTHKRKISCLKSPNQRPRIDIVIARAKKIINQIENMEDQNFKMK